MYNIYKITTRSNGKVYVGQTKRDVSFRLAEHKFNAKNRSHCDLHNHISEFGVQDLTIEILEICSDDLVNEREQYWIKLLDSTNIEKGYNKAKGGKGNPGMPVSEETRSKLRASNKGFTAEAREKIRQKLIGRKLSDEHKQKITEANLHISKRIYQYSTNFEFISEYKSISDAARTTKSDRRSIQRQLNLNYDKNTIPGRVLNNMKFFWSNKEL